MGDAMDEPAVVTEGTEKRAEGVRDAYDFRRRGRSSPIGGGASRRRRRGRGPRVT